MKITLCLGVATLERSRPTAFTAVPQAGLQAVASSAFLALEETRASQIPASRDGVLARLPLPSGAADRDGGTRSFREERETWGPPALTATGPVVLGQATLPLHPQCSPLYNGTLRETEDERSTFSPLHQVLDCSSVLSLGYSQVAGARKHQTGLSALHGISYEAEGGSRSR